MLPLIPLALVAAKTTAAATITATQYFVLGAAAAEAVKGKKSLKKILKEVR